MDRYQKKKDERVLVSVMTLTQFKSVENSGTFFAVDIITIILSHLIKSEKII